MDRLFLLSSLSVATIALCGLYAAPLPADSHAAQSRSQIAPSAQSVQSVPAKTPYFLSPSQLPLASLLPSPPPADSAAGRADLLEVHRIERIRTAEQIREALYDDTHEDIFVYSSVLGKEFNADALPLTFALSKHLRNDAGLIDNPLKDLYKRPRPYNFDRSLHPVCETNQEMSYPSGHSINGYLYAFTLADILPSKHDDILKRADEYAHNRVVCGSHYPSDTEASKRAASIIFGALLVTPRFLAELDAARTEVRQHLARP